MDMKEQNGEMKSPIAFCFPTGLHGLWRTRLQGESKDYEGTSVTHMVIFFITSAACRSTVKSKFKPNDGACQLQVLFGIF